MHSTKNSESQRNGSANVRRPSWLTQLIGNINRKNTRRQHNDPPKND
ncbi:hypothetical protein [Klebsiella pneumoniae]|nr:hypothetical protein [Klebsiella pneumoniae]MCP3188345.1 hypothetical protein [Klebsiella pneumoniae]